MKQLPLFDLTQAILDETPSAFLTPAKRCLYCGGPLPAGWPIKAHEDGFVHFFKKTCQDWLADLAAQSKAIN